MAEFKSSVFVIKMSIFREFGVSTHSVKTLKGHIDQIRNKSVRKLSVYNKFCNSV